MSKRVSLNHFSRTRFQCFLSNPPLSSFKKLIVLTPRLVQGLRTMSLAKAVPKGIKDRECKRFTLQERPPVPYVPEKDPVQETVSLLKSDKSLKTTIGVDAELCPPIWHCGTRCRRPPIPYSTTLFLVRLTRSDAIRVTRPDRWVRPEVLSPTPHRDIGWQSHHIITESSSWCRTAFLHRFLVLDRPNTSDLMVISMDLFSLDRARPLSF